MFLCFRFLLSSELEEKGWKQKTKELPIFFHFCFFFCSFLCSFWRLLRDTMVRFPLTKGPAFFGGWFLHIFALFQKEKTSNPGLVWLVFDSLPFWSPAAHKRTLAVGKIKMVRITASVQGRVHAHKKRKAMTTSLISQLRRWTWIWTCSGSNYAVTSEHNGP